MTIANEQFTARKNRKKRIRTAGQILFLLALTAFCLNAFLPLTAYIPYTEQPVKVSGDKGFVALSYGGVERTGTRTAIGADRLRQHLQALKELGYVTISQQDIADYYRSGKELPEKSLFLIFEDGRRDTAIFAQKTLEELNFKATMLSDAEHVAKQDPKFLTPDELKKLEKTSFWELDASGRLAFANRKGSCFNYSNGSIYHLTAMQPQAYWSANHLLMRIQYDTHQPVVFVQGDPNRLKAWEMLKGAAEWQEETVILTSLPKDKGLLRLKNSNDFADLKLSVRLRGNKAGLQKIYLRAGEKLGRFLAVAIQDNILYVTERTGGVERELFRLNLDQRDGKTALSVPMLTLSLAGDRISVQVDGQAVVTGLPVSNTQAGSVYLETAWSSKARSQRNLVDDVYDGVFEKLVITENTGAATEKVLFDSRMQGWDAVQFTVRKYWQAIIHWFIVNL